MTIDRQLFESILFKRFQPVQRFTQDSPVYPSVWMEYFDHRDELEFYRVDLILTPHKKSSAAELFLVLTNWHDYTHKLRKEPVLPEWHLASNGETVVVKLTLDELLYVALPLTNWWHYYLFTPKGEPTADLKWLRQVIAAIYYHGDNIPPLNDTKYVNQWLDSLERGADQYLDTYGQLDMVGPIALWSVNLNRQATLSIEKSVPATKADAGRRLFDIDGKGITWAIMDSGIDARHLAFRKKDPATGEPYAPAMGEPIDKFSNKTRVVATYDFTQFRQIITDVFLKSYRDRNKSSAEIVTASSDKNDQRMPQMEIDRHLNQINYNLQHGLQLDWSLIAPLLRIPHNQEEYTAPQHPHGTHVAGIVGANLVTDNGLGNLIGMCPGIELYDIRVMDAQGKAQEFNILAAIHFIRWLNSQKDRLVVQGVNMSFSMTHDVASYACGQTPVCTACERLVAEGTVVVAAAGNQGQSIFQGIDNSFSQGFRMVNITDPGNAEKVITVGATHRNEPHAYGVSYFSSKGPTGDGRLKPDLVAPGEKITSTSLDGGDETMDGTSMAAPHVSGAAALILAKHNELIGRPEKVKDVLCRTATDLGREKYFQGCGMLDVLRAIQAV